MRSLVTATLRLAPFLAYFAAYLLPHRRDDEATVEGINVLEYNIDTAYAKFTIPCLACSGAAADDALVFELQPDANRSITLNGHFLLWDAHVPHYPGPDAVLVTTTDLSGSVRAVDVSVSGSVTTANHLTSDDIAEKDPLQHVHFRFRSIDGRTTSDQGFIAIVRLTEPVRKMHKLLRTQGARGIVDWVDFRNLSAVHEPSAETAKDTNKANETDSEFDLEAEIETLALLGAEAEDLTVRIRAKEHAIINHIREHNSRIPLKQLLKQCDGILCATTVIAERICDNMGVANPPTFAYTLLQQNPHFQHTVAFPDEAEKPRQASRNCTESKQSKDAEAASLQPTLTKNGTVHAYPQFQPVAFVSPTNSLIHALGIIAGILGLAALCAFLRRRCMSMRKRVERAADKEERRNRRAYRQAARRASMRRRWDNFVAAVSCFRQEAEPRFEDYEEKRALILQDAFLEQDLDQAEKGEVMEAEIRELRHAHEIVASLVRVDENRYDLVTPINDPPPSLVPLPYTPALRPRASTGILPSYTPESLPDYSSPRQSGEGSGSVVVDGFAKYTPTSMDEEGRSTPDATSSVGTGRTRYTPMSSIIAISPRCSEETLRTRQSKEIQDP